MGPAALALGVLLFSNVKVTKHDIKQILLFLFYPCVSALAYTLIKNPDLTSYKFELGANFDTAGGFGSNQVSTILGLGMFLCLVFWVNKWRIFRNKNIPIVLGLLFAFQAFLTFSRGGLIGGVIAILVLVYCLNSSGAKLKKRYNIRNTLKYIIPIAITLLFSFQVVDQITGGVLTLRYQGHTNATTKGYKEIDADTFTSGRFGMMEEDLMIWNDNFLFGVGLGSSRYLRETHTAVSHIELSRLLAEHGMFGLLYFLIVVFVGIRTYFKNRRKNMKYQGVLVALFVLGLYTSFHAATRTFVTPLLIGLSMLDFKEGYESE
jgi:O-antigen ligase